MQKLNQAVLSTYHKLFARNKSVTDSFLVLSPVIKNIEGFKRKERWTAIWLLSTAGDSVLCIFRKALGLECLYWKTYVLGYNLSRPYISFNYILLYKFVHQFLKLFREERAYRCFYVGFNNAVYLLLDLNIIVIWSIFISLITRAV